jgi:predicted transposase YdaD
MSDSDTTIKLLMLTSAGEMFRLLGLAPVTEWLNVELPKLQNRRADLVGRTASREIIHIELQRRNDPRMPLRMAEYALAILRIHKQYPRQLLLFVGNRKLTMRPRLETRGMSFRYEQVDIREMDGERLIESKKLSDNVLGLLARLDNTAEGIRKVLLKIARLNPGERQDALALLFSAAELRDLQHNVKEEMKKVPFNVKTSINDKTFGPWIRKGMEEGLEKGLEKGREKGRDEGLALATRFVLNKRFGHLPPGISRRLSGLSETQAQQILAGVLEGKTLAQLFPSTPRRLRG